MQIVKLLRYVWQHPMNAQGRFAALSRVARWQIASRLLRGPIALPFVDDAALFASRGMTGATGNWYCGLHEASEMAFVLHVLRPDEHFADVGANIGSYSVLAAAGAKARVTCVEPIPATFSHLERNILLNGLAGRIRACMVGLSDRKGLLRFSRDLDTVNHVLTQGEDLAAIDVPVTTLDELVGDDTPVLVKIDVEGHELPVLQGAQRILADQRLMAVIMETNGSGERYGVPDTALTEIMLAHGFSAFGYDPFRRKLTSLDLAEGNTFFVRDKLGIEQRLTTAKRSILVNGSI